MHPSQDELKHEAALRALDYVREGMALGLGTGSTAKHAVRELGKRVAEGLSVTGVPTSESTGHLAEELGIPLTTLEECGHLDLTIDGADEVRLDTLDVIKGLGGALLREKIVALSTEEVTLIVDETKVVERLGTHAPLPVEVISFGWKRTADQLEALGCSPVLRLGPEGEPYITDGGNYLLDCRFPEGISDPYAVGTAIKAITGVVDHGLFLGIARRVIVAGSGGVQVFERRG